MSSLFIAQLIGWLLVTLGSVWIVMQALDFRRRTNRLPAACHLDDLDTRIAVHEATLSELTGKHVRLTKELTEIDARRVEGLKWLDEVSASREWLEEAREELLKVQNEREQQESLRASLDKLTQETTRLRNEIGSNETILREQAERIAAAKATHEGVTQLLQHQQVKSDELTRALTDKETKLAQLQGVQTELAQVEAIMRAKGLERTELEAELTRLRTDAESLNAARSEARVQISTLTVERDALLKQMESLQHHIDSLRQLADKTAASLGKPAAEDRYRDLWLPLPFKSLKARNGGTEQAQLNKVSNYLTNLGLRFPSRTLHAFHTALKSADISPVTVLAGISGTGKSELPKRYAEGMGMHFVGLPVQPRWDSPTDLFGFFNHLEGRFKATELARALVQFEKRNRSQWPLPHGWNHGLEDQMLLVLLDEMNLARVEYYFSDFLSRLETRRGVNPDSESDRAKAELALDMGSLGKDEKPIRFFPDRNVLFTGTMNEDESTQTLSDKVLDRACVLRFGRPRKLASVKSGGIAESSPSALSTKEWENWLVAAKPASSMMEDRIGRLNDAMEEMGRPFGHRVSQAIMTYSSHYPAWIPDRENLALADQIEQRILPKLRGMDTSDFGKPLGKIEAVLKETGDATLLAAFQSGRKEGAFLWRGVDRDA